MKNILTIYLIIAWSSVFAQRTTLPNTATQSPSNKNLYNANGQVITGRLVVNDSCWFNGDQSLFDGNVGIGTVSPDFNLHVAGSFFAEKTVGGRTVHMGIDTFVGFTQIFSEFTSGDTSNVIGITPGDAYMRANTDGTDYDVIMNISDPGGVKIQGKSTTTGNALTILEGDTTIFGGDTIFEFQNNGDLVIPKFAGSAQKIVTALADGTLDTASSLFAFTTDVDDNMWCSPSGYTGEGALNFVVGIQSGANILNSECAGNTLVGYLANIIGDSVTAATAIGFQAAAAESGLAIGYNAQSDSNAIAIGQYATVNHRYSIALGINATTTTSNQMVISDSITQVVMQNAQVIINQIAYGDTLAPATDIGTLTNLPAGTAGNPTGFIEVEISGVIRKIPYW